MITEQPLSFFENNWQVISSAIVFLIGIWVALFQKKILHIPQQFAVFLYFWHTIFCLYNYYTTLNNPSDSTGYYLQSFYSNELSGFGTPAIVYITSLFSQGLSMSYGGIFLVFNIVGYIGLLAFAVAMKSVTINGTQLARGFSLLILLLPGFSFWSGSIGKDAITFLGAGLATWAALDINRRIPAMAMSVLFFLIPRPHMGGILLISLSFALLFSSRLGVAKKIALILVAVPTTFFGTLFALNYIGLGNLSELAQITDYVETRQGYNLEGGSSVDIASMPVPIRMFTYLFRPLFFDAQSFLGLIVSSENLVLLFMFLCIILRQKRTRSVLNFFEIFFFSIFAITSWLVLANTTANLGIAIRQKLMFLPMLIVLALSFWQKSNLKYRSFRRTR